MLPIPSNAPTPGIPVPLETESPRYPGDLHKPFVEIADSVSREAKRTNIDAASNKIPIPGMGVLKTTGIGGLGGNSQHAIGTPAGMGVVKGSDSGAGKLAGTEPKSPGASMASRTQAYLKKSFQQPKSAWGKKMVGGSGFLAGYQDPDRNSLTIKLQR